MPFTCGREAEVHVHVYMANCAHAVYLFLAAKWFPSVFLFLGLPSFIRQPHEVYLLRVATKCSWEAWERGYTTNPVVAQCVVSSDSLRFLRQYN